MLSLKPDLTDGTVAILDTDGNPVGVARARASRTIPGYVTLISDTPLGYAIRVPADWAIALEEAATRSMPEEIICSGIDCNRPLHGYRGPLCRYCNGEAE